MGDRYADDVGAAFLRRHKATLWPYAPDPSQVEVVSSSIQACSSRPEGTIVQSCVTQEMT